MRDAPEDKAPDSLRAKKRIALMRHAQRAALDLFEAHGFDAVTVEQIAAAAEVSTPTIYRHFGTKEQIVLWDEYDPLLLASIAERLPHRAALAAVRDGLVGALDPIYAKDAARILRRARLIIEHPALGAANAASMSALRRGLAKTFADANACRDALEADVMAAAIVGTLEVAIEHWVEGGGREPLRRLFTSAFRRLGRISRAPAARTPRARRAPA
jgi:AcrR family transcriptional regulator